MMLSLHLLARTEIENVIKYSKETFGESAATKFYTQLQQCFSRLLAHPFLGPTEPLLAKRKLQYRALLVFKHFKLIYYVDEKQNIIHVVDLWDTRREPKRLAHRLPSR